MVHQASEFSRKVVFNRTWDLLSHRWKFYIVYLLGQHPMRFGELRRTCSGISRVTLTAYLRQLEQENFVSRYAGSEPYLFSEYSLTALGQSAIPAINALMKWGFDVEGE